MESGFVTSRYIQGCREKGHVIQTEPVSRIHDSEMIQSYVCKVKPELIS